MASPQTENGYTKIANELLEALSRTKLNSQESRILFAIFRKTYGFRKKEDWISNSQLELITGIHRCHCANTITRLKERNIVTKTGNKIQFNKNYMQWRMLPKQVTKQVIVPKQVTSSTQTGNQLVPKQVHTKETITKETIQKKPEDFFKNFSKEDEKLIRHWIKGFSYPGTKEDYNVTNVQSWVLHLVNKYGVKKFRRAIDVSNKSGNPKNSFYEVLNN